MLQYMTVKQFTWTHPATSLSTETSRVTSTFQKAIKGGKGWETGQCQLISEIDANQHPLNAAKHESTVPRFGKFRDFSEFLSSFLLSFLALSLPSSLLSVLLSFAQTLANNKTKERPPQQENPILKQATSICGIQNIDCLFLRSS